LPSAKTIYQRTIYRLMRPKINTNYTNYISCLTFRLETSEPAATVRSTGRGTAVPGGGDERWAGVQLTTPKTSDTFLNRRYLYKQTTYLSFKPGVFKLLCVCGPLFVIKIFHGPPHNTHIMILLYYLLHIIIRFI